MHAVAAQTERVLAEEAQVNVKIEQDIALLRSMFTDPTNLPLESAQRLRSMEQANAVLHANLAATRTPEGRWWSKTQVETLLTF